MSFQLDPNNGQQSGGNSPQGFSPQQGQGNGNPKPRSYLSRLVNAYTIIGVILIAVGGVLIFTLSDLPLNDNFFSSENILYLGRYVLVAAGVFLTVKGRNRAVELAQRDRNRF